MHTHIRTHTLSHSHTLSLSTHSLSLTHTLSLHTHTLSLSHSLSHTHSLTVSHTVSHTRTHTLSPTLSLSLSHTGTHTHTHTLSLSHTLCLTGCHLPEGTLISDVTGWTQDINVARPTETVGTGRDVTGYAALLCTKFKYSNVSHDTII